MGTAIMVLMVLAALGLAVLLAVAVVAVLVPVFRGIGWVVRQVARFVAGEIRDLLRIVGSLVAQSVLMLLTLGSIVIGRWSAAKHYGRALMAEWHACGAALYRILLGHPLRLLCLTSLTEAIEQRLPAVVAQAPGPDRSPLRDRLFPGYRIVGSLPGGGSGARLYVAEPDVIRRAVFERDGHGPVACVVIKCFSIGDGSTLPQIVRESRALEAARRLGLVLDHQLSEDRFYYVTRYVPGDSLTLAIGRLHARSGPEGLSRDALATALGWAADLLRTLDVYHRGGLWHKDVKPDNIVVEGARAHLVDFGLITPLRSPMTLTTHGTEYFRDPEMVRLAMRGVKVDQVDGARFDIYAAGAVLFNIVENSFPAHGGLSQITRRCPPALGWIIRRAMTDYDRRYSSAAAMLADLEALRTAPDPFTFRVADLPSMRQAGLPDGTGAAVDPSAPAFAARDEGQAERVAARVGSRDGLPDAGAATVPRAAPRRSPRIRVTDWWSGAFVVDEPVSGPEPGRSDHAWNGRNVEAGGSGDERSRCGKAPLAATGRVGNGGRRSAAEQLARARARLAQTRARASQRIAARRASLLSPASGGTLGVVLVVLLFFAAMGFLVVASFTNTWSTIPVGVESLAAEDEPAAVGQVPEVRPGGSPASVSPMHNRSQSGALPVSARDSLAPVPPPITLVISDVQPLTPAIVAALDRLQAAGLPLLGDPRRGAGADPQAEATIALIAQAQRERGLDPVDSADTRQRLARWLTKHPEAGLLVWFARAGPDARVHYVVISPADLSADDPRSAWAARAARALADRLP